VVYIKKDSNNTIIDLSLEIKEGFEKKSIFDQEIKKFLKNDKEKIKTILCEIDLSMVRITEDLIDILIQNENMLFTDLPEVVQNKLNFKKMLREQLSPSQIIYEEHLKL
jgi:hypothetical protein